MNSQVLIDRERKLFEDRFGKLYDLVFNDETEDYENENDQALWYGWKTRAALVIPMEEPIYQYGLGVQGSSWSDVSKESHDAYAARGGWATRTVYAAPLAKQDIGQVGSADRHFYEAGFAAGARAVAKQVSQRISELEVLLRESVGMVRGIVGNGDNELGDRIDAALSTKHGDCGVTE